MYSDSGISEECLLGEMIVGPEGEDICPRSHRCWNHRKIIWAAQLAFFLTSLLIFFRDIARQPLYQRCNCKDHMPMYSPALEAVRNTGHFQRFDGSFATPNVFKGTPNPAIDEAWAGITYKDGSRSPDCD